MIKPNLKIMKWDKRKDRKFCNLSSTFIKPDSTQNVAESHLTPDVNMLPVVLRDVYCPVFGTEGSA
jgi:hypothetical protein